MANGHHYSHLVVELAIECFWLISFMNQLVMPNVRLDLIWAGICILFMVLMSIKGTPGGHIYELHRLRGLAIQAAFGYITSTFMREIKTLYMQIH